MRLNKFLTTATKVISIALLAVFFQRCGAIDETEKFIDKWISSNHLESPETHFIRIEDGDYDGILEIALFLNAQIEEANGNYEASCDCILMSNDNILYFDNNNDQVIFQEVRFVRGKNVQVDI